MTDGDNDSPHELEPHNSIRRKSVSCLQPWEHNMYGISKKSNYICSLSFLIVTVNISFFWKITSVAG